MLIHLLSFDIISSDFSVIQSGKIVWKINGFGDSKGLNSSILMCLRFLMQVFVVVVFHFLFVCLFWGGCLFVVVVLIFSFKVYLTTAFYFMLQLVQVNNIVLSGNIYLQKESYPNTGDNLSKDK